MKELKISEEKTYSDGLINIYDFGIVKVTKYMERPDKKPLVYLPHSCDEWEIGSTVKEVQDMIDQLEAAKKLLQD